MTFTEVYSSFEGPVRSMLSDWMRQSEQALRQRPTGSAVRDANFVAVLVQNTLSCKTCASDVRHDQIVEFIDFYAQKIDEAVAKVSIDTAIIA